LLGADVTGVDISDEAVEFATTLSADSGIPATFARSDLFDWFDNADPDQFDVAFCSYGSIYWLSDLGPWAAGIAKVLDVFQVYPYTNGAVFGDGMRELPGRRLLPPAELPGFPMMYGVRAVSPALR
jgi:SAM-dependent methyltransferase